MSDQPENSLLIESSNNVIVSEPGSQVELYQFGVGSTTHPGGYRYQCPNLDTDQISLNYFFEQLNGAGLFVNSDGMKLNMIHMIAESFKEAHALR